MVSSVAHFNFAERVAQPLVKRPIRVLQVNVGRRCNLACTHCHVEAGPHRSEEMSPAVTAQVIAAMQRFPQIETVDLTGGAPELHAAFRPLVVAAREAGKAVIVRSNLTVYFVPGCEDLPEFCAQWGVRIVASLPCYLEDGVDRQRGHGTYEASIRALQRLNALGYGDTLSLDLVYNPPLGPCPPLPPPQGSLEQAYKSFLGETFGIRFHRLLALANLPVGRTRLYLERQGTERRYLKYLAERFNPATLPGLMCGDHLSVDYRGHLYDCDFHQMEDLPLRSPTGQALTLADCLAANSLDLAPTVQTAAHCFGCTAGCGSSCGGALA